MSNLLLTQDVAKQAVEMHLATIEAQMKARIFKREHLHIVVSKSDLPRMDYADWISAGILYEHSIGSGGDWEHNYLDIARSKCFLSCSYQMSTREIQLLYPWLLEAGDTSYFGSVYRKGIAVACSGVEPYFDEMIAGWVLDTCCALCFRAQQRIKTDKNGFIVA